MGKNKLKKFAEMQTFHCVFECPARQLRGGKDTESDIQAKYAMAGNWRSQFFHNDHPIVLELGCGRGEYTVGLAQAYPHINFIGVDIKGARLWAGAKQAEEAGMKNVAFLRTNIELLPSFFDALEVDEIWITFPDPQMKKATKRLTSTYFLARYEQVMKPGGLVHLKTDSPFLYTYTHALIEANGYSVVVDTDNLYGETETVQIQNARRLQTHYEHQWLDRGMLIKYICFELEPKLNKKEPDIEIEKDDYRSYGRNYISTNNVLPGIK